MGSFDWNAAAAQATAQRAQTNGPASWTPSNSSGASSSGGVSRAQQVGGGMFGAQQCAPDRGAPGALVDPEPGFIRENWLGKEGTGVDTNYTAVWGTVDLGSPMCPGAGTESSWWVPDKIGPWDMKPYMVVHDSLWDGSRGLTDLGAILDTEWQAFKAGMAGVRDPIHFGLQTLYSGATLTAGVGLATYNTATSIGSSVWDAVSDVGGKLWSGISSIF